MNLVEIIMEDVEQIHLVHNRDHSRAFVKLVMNFQVP
jgi:hypothetical protein